MLSDRCCSVVGSSMVPESYGAGQTTERQGS
uniref:Uncharacterized protein n=1 Tax=Anguilla anguilla TaxID=7936 RepID=A0A0E9PPY9_ANGAN